MKTEEQVTVAWAVMSISGDYLVVEEQDRNYPRISR